ncbi:MAG TPA: chromate transporter [Clostridiaceae bacterium]|nr:chromate transporter [Clostridiaceae bacterium]
MATQKQKFSRLLVIYFAFFKMGALTFGGGYTMLPILESEVVEKRKWIDGDKVVDYYALSQGLPGIIAVNVSVFIGYHCMNTPGGIAAALGVVSPSVIIIMILATLLKGFMENVYVQYALAGILVCVSALMVSTIIGLWKKSEKDFITVFIYLVVVIFSIFTSVSPMVCVIGAAIIGIIVQKIKKK